MKQHLALNITCPKGLEGLLSDECKALGAEVGRETVGAVSVSAPQEVAYRLCLWSRLANRVLLPLNDYPCHDADSLYAGMKAIDWSAHVAAGGTISVDFAGSNREIRNSHFGALRCKDAVVDAFQERSLDRPSVDKQRPDLRIHVRLRKGRAVVAIDLSGESLHRRGYRQAGAMAPLKENLAAALLLRADWPGIAARGGALIDPLCGSGTLLIEGAMMAMDIAPGLQRRYWGFSGWRQHRPDMWQRILEDAQRRQAVAMTRQWPEIRGYDAGGKILAQAQDNIDRAGLQSQVRVSRRELANLTRPTHREMNFGLVICNPPYGERLGDEAELVHLYRHLGQRLLAEFEGWQAAVFTGNPSLGKRMGLRSRRQYQFLNGTLPSKLLLFDVNADNAVKERTSAQGHSEAVAPKLSTGGEMFANRLRKNLKQLQKWCKREGVSCYRAYDADMPEYAVAVDVYGSAVHIAEYAAPSSVDEDKARQRLRDTVEACAQVFELPETKIAIKERRRQRGTEQYRRQSETGEFLEVEEGQARLLVNLHDYLDTGLFLDHRPVRLDIAKRAAGQRFLNLFCYTGAATVHAGVGGARHSTSVDMSNTYLQWARRNLSLNGLSEVRHRTVRADCRQWLAECDEEFDLILLDPPTFSNSKRMEDVLDIQRDHVALIEGAMARLSAQGLLIFSNNRRDFQLDAAVTERFCVEDRTSWSLDEDFKRRKKPIHYCWYIRHR